MNLAETLLKHLPDAVLITEGLDSGKYETTDWLFHLECGFFVRKSDRKTWFVKREYGRLEWDELFCNGLPYASTNTPIVKVVG